MAPGRPFSVAVMLGASLGCLLCLALAAASPGPSAAELFAPVPAATTQVAAATLIAAPSTPATAPEGVAWPAPVEGEAAPPAAAEAGVAAVVGLCGGAAVLGAALAVAVQGLWRRVSRASPPVDLEAGGPTYQSVLLREAGRPSLALGAKKGIHPEMYEAPVYCGGELVMTTNGTKKEYVVDIWSGNHPFYQNKGGVVVSDAGRLERFKNKYGKLGGLGSFGEVPTSTGPTVALKLEPKAKKKPGKK
eukprot:EG_transcript_18705